MSSGSENGDGRRPSDGEAPVQSGARATRDEFRTKAHQRKVEIERQLEVTRAQIDATNERITARTGRNLIFAIGIGLALGVLVVVSLLVIKELFMVFAGLIVAFAAVELASALRHAGRDVPRIPTVAVAVLMVPAAFYFGVGGAWAAFLAGCALVTVWRLIEALVVRLRPSAAQVSGRDVALDIGLGIFIQAYVTFLGSFAILLVAEEDGQWWTLAFLILVVAVDVGAYASGLTWGKHPMAPRISPKKTWEGFAGAAAAAVVGGVLLALFMLDQPWWVGALMGSVFVLTATMGDLAESLIKRDIGIKDMSSWLPGHGGFLDRLDSILPSAAAAYALYLVFGS